MPGISSRKTRRCPFRMLIIARLVNINYAYGMTNPPIAATTPKKATLSFISFGLAIASIVLSTVVTDLVTRANAEHADGASLGLYVFGAALAGFGAGLAFSITALVTGVIGVKRKLPYRGFGITAIVLAAYYLTCAHFIALLFYSGPLLSSLT